jgi:organic radical activating enzyme
MKKKLIDNLEIEITRDCNLKCKGCSHYCDYTTEEINSDDDKLQSIINWSKYLEPTYFDLLGGEPLLNNRLLDYIKISGEHFYNSQIQIFTNGILIKEKIIDNKEILKSIKKYNIRIVYTDYFNNLNYNKIIKLFPLITRLENNWRRIYIGNNFDIKPFKNIMSEDNLKLIYKNCPCKECTTLFNNKIYHCSFVTYFPLIYDRLKYKDLWNLVLDYEPLTLDNINDIENYKFDQPIKQCILCPDKFYPLKWSN